MNNLTRCERRMAIEKTLIEVIKQVDKITEKIAQLEEELRRLEKY